MLSAALLSLIPVQAPTTPLYFEQNGGRYGPEVAFVARARGQAIHLRPDGFDLALQALSLIHI